jgi:hypothetical protein
MEAVLREIDYWVANEHSFYGIEFDGKASGHASS